MAKKKATKAATGESNVNKTAEIKKALAATPEKPPKEIADNLIAKGVDVTPGYVSTIKTNLKKASETRKKTGKKRVTKKKVGRKKRGTASAKASGITYEQLQLAKQLAKNFGGVEEAKAALNALSQLRD
ncbi:MAG: hypothetical protein JJ992_17080 [Planctomycetes bacterium]|nr:hypothetical protein [Planctomycetota bacterium]